MFDGVVEIFRFLHVIGIITDDVCVKHIKNTPKFWDKVDDYDEKYRVLPKELDREQ
jgi:hypothetical protein